MIYYALLKGDWDSNLYSIDYQHFEKHLRSNKVYIKNNNNLCYNKFNRW